MTTTTETTPVNDLPGLTTQIVNRLLGVTGVDSTDAVTAALKELGYGRCAYCQHPGGPAELEKINNGPSFGCRDIKACRQRQVQLELASQLSRARNLASLPSAPPSLAEAVNLIDHLLARLGTPGAELHPELED